MIASPYQIREYISNPIKESLMATCKLIISIQPNSVIYMIISPQEQIVSCKECFNEKNISQTMFLRLILEKERILSAPFLESRVYISDAPFTIIPNQFWQNDYKVALSRLLLQDIFDQKEIGYSHIHTISSRLLFPLPGFIIGFLDQYLKHYTMSHIAAPFISAVNKTIHKHENAIFTLILEKQILVAAVANGQFKLCNTFPFDSIADGIYFVQSVRDVVDLKDKSIPHFVLGNIEPKDHHVKGLWNYFPNMEFPDLLRRNLSEDIPWWKFSFMNA